jgi:hypothetical protein
LYTALDSCADGRGRGGRGGGGAGLANWKIGDGCGRHAARLTRKKKGGIIFFQRCHTGMSWGSFGPAFYVFFLSGAEICQKYESYLSGFWE